MSNRFPEEAKTLALSTTEQVIFFCFLLIGFVWVLLVPVEKHTGRFMISTQFPVSYISFVSSRLGRCSLAGGLGQDALWWGKNVAGGRLRSHSRL